MLGILHTGIADVADIVQERREPVPGQPETGTRQQVRRGHRSQRLAHVLQCGRVDFVQGEDPTNLSAVCVQAVRDRLHLLPAQSVFRAECGNVLRGRRYSGWCCCVNQWL